LCYLKALVCLYTPTSSLILSLQSENLTLDFDSIGMVAALTNESATSKSVYFAHCTSEMIFITHLLTEEPEKLAGPLLADTYVTLLKGRNAWYGQKLAKGELSLEMGDSIKGKGMIQVIFSTHRHGQ
jgi:glycerol-3-phosphate dehydrogenase (NAD+)